MKAWCCIEIFSSTTRCMSTKQIGDWGEEHAALFLVAAGYEIIQRNFRTRFAEIDIIAWHEKQHFGKTLCFVEVKTRKRKDGSATRSVNRKKIEQLFKGAKEFCRKYNISIDATPIQFEQVSVFGKDRNIEPRIRHYVIPIE